MALQYVAQMCGSVSTLGWVKALLAEGCSSKPAHCYPSHMKVSEILRLLQTDGWYLVATRGSHRQYKHAMKPGRVTVPGKPSDDLAPGTLNSILKQATLKS